METSSTLNPRGMGRHTRDAENASIERAHQMGSTAWCSRPSERIYADFARKTGYMLANIRAA